MKPRILSLFYAVTCGVVAIILLYLGARLPFLFQVWGHWGWGVLLYSGVSFSLAGVGFLMLRGKMFFKRTDGTLPAWTILPYFPYLALYLAPGYLWDRLFQKNPMVEIYPNIFLSAYLWPFHPPPPSLNAVIDATFEIWENPLLRSKGYLSLPLFYGELPDVQQLKKAILHLKKGLKKGAVLIHCYQGRTRSALFAAALLLTMDPALDGATALETIKKHRWIRYTRREIELLNEFRDFYRSQSWAI